MRRLSAHAVEQPDDVVVRADCDEPAVGRDRDCGAAPFVAAERPRRVRRAEGPEPHLVVGADHESVPDGIAWYHHNATSVGPGPCYRPSDRGFARMQHAFRPGASRPIQTLLDSDPALQLSVDLRNRTIVPLGFLQVALLRRLRDQNRQPPMSEAATGSRDGRTYSRSELLRGALLTINGIAAGMRNTG